MCPFFLCLFFHISMMGLQNDCNHFRKHCHRNVNSFLGLYSGNASLSPSKKVDISFYSRIVHNSPQWKQDNCQPDDVQINRI